MKTLPIPKGFCVVNEEDEIYVNKNGDVYNHKTGRISTVHSVGDVTIHSYSVERKSKSFHLARAVAINFLPIPKEFTGEKLKNLHIAYKDGDKTNVAVENLQWVFNTRCRPLKVIDSIGIEKIYRSIEHAWIELGSSSYSAFSIAVRKGFLKKQGLKFEML